MMKKHDANGGSRADEKRYVRCVCAHRDMELACACVACGVSGSDVNDLGHISVPCGPACTMHYVYVQYTLYRVLRATIHDRIDERADATHTHSRHSPPNSYFSRV